MLNDADANLVKVGVTVATAVSAFFWALIRWIIGDQLARNKEAHEQLSKRCDVLESKIDGIATRADVAEVHRRMDAWTQNRVTLGDINYQNRILNDIKTALGLPTQE